MNKDDYIHIEKLTEVLEYIGLLEDENRRLKLVIGLMEHKRPRGRPKKKESLYKAIESSQKRGRPRKVRTTNENLLSEIDAIKKRFNTKFDTKALEFLAKDIAKSEGLRESRALEPDMKKKIKSLRNRISKARKSQ